MVRKIHDQESVWGILFLMCPSHLAIAQLPSTDPLRLAHMRDRKMENCMYEVATSKIYILFPRSHVSLVWSQCNVQKVHYTAQARGGEQDAWSLKLFIRRYGRNGDCDFFEEHDRTHFFLLPITWGVIKNGSQKKIFFHPPGLKTWKLFRNFSYEEPCLEFSTARTRLCRRTYKPALDRSLVVHCRGFLTSSLA
jgi:hypothetical protein